MNASSSGPPQVRGGPLEDVRVIEASILGGAAVTTHLADLGADVIKIERPGGDYVREMTWPIIEGVSLMHLHINRGKKSVELDLKSDGGKKVFRDLVSESDVVVEAMRPGALKRMGLGYEELCTVNERLVFCRFSGYGSTGPYRDLPSHGIAFDTWAGIVEPEVDEHGFTRIPKHVSIGINAGPMVGSMSILAAVIEARSSGEGCFVDVAQSDSAAFFDWYRSETWMAYERSEEEVTGNKSDDYERRAPGTEGMREGVRYQIYRTSDGHVLFMASEREFWRNFCIGVEREDLFSRWPGSEYADHARGNLELQQELTDIFKQRSTEEWIEFGGIHNTPIAPVNTPKNITEDPQFRHRFPVMSHEDHQADMLPFPAKFAGTDLSDPSVAPSAGEHTEEVLRSVAGYGGGRLAELREDGVFG